jgi:hypothetical protein
MGLGAALPVGAVESLNRAPHGQQQTRRYAVIIANNSSDDDGAPALAYADDDGAKYFELFHAAGAEVELLAVLDPLAQSRYPAALAIAKPPLRSSLSAALTSIFERIRADSKAGCETHFYFVYTGHGNLGPNHEGYLNLLDGPFRRSELYREVLARSPASFNHIILDACHAYFMVQKRGVGADKQGNYRSAVNDFLRTEDLAAYPNTGVIFAASSESETQEWSRWEAGIFSHELRSALLGGADVNGDGRITYAEAGAFIEAANATVDIPRARLHVFSRPPSMYADVALFDTSSFVGVPSLVVDPQHAGRYHVEDIRGVRIADLNSSREQSIHLALVGRAPFYLRTSAEEARIPERDRIEVSELSLGPVGDVSRGSVETTFRRHLFEVAFGMGFYQGTLSGQAAQQSDFDMIKAPQPANTSQSGAHSLRPWAVGSFAAALLAGAAAGVLYYSSHVAYESYQSAQTRDDALRWRETTEDRLLASRVLLGAAGAAAAAGVLLLVLDHRQSGATVAPAISFGGHLEAGVTFSRFW